MLYNIQGELKMANKTQYLEKIARKALDMVTRYSVDCSSLDMVTRHSVDCSSLDMVTRHQDMV